MSDSPRPADSFRAAFEKLRKNRLAWMAVVIIAMFAWVAVFADIIASDLPLFGKIRGHTVFLACVSHPKELNAVTEAERIHRHLESDEWAVFPVLPYSPVRARPGTERLQSPTFAHPLGTDSVGRDVAARIVHGARTAFTMALLAIALALLCGVIAGGLSGFYGGTIDAFVTRGVEVLSAFPTLVVVLVVQAILARPSFGALLLGIALGRLPEITRLVRAEVLLVRAQDYVLAARVLGASEARILIKYILPNVKAPIIVAAALSAAQVVLLEAALAFLRAGAPGAASWGAVMAELRLRPSAFWLLLFPGICVAIVAASFNLVGEALRDLLDPRLRFERLDMVGRNPA